MPTGRIALLSLVSALAALLCAAAASAGSVPKRIVFPVAGKVTYQDDFGDPRPGRSHAGNDLMGKRFQYAVAAEAGRVEKMGVGTMYSCWLVLHGRSGTEYWYIHLNNDKPGRPANDNEGGCRGGIAWPRTLKQGQYVRPGRVVGYVGDSGDANGGQPHVHFEIHPNGGRAVNPYNHLQRARTLLYASPPRADSLYLRLHGVVRKKDDRLKIRTRVVRSSAGRFFRVSKRIALDLPTGVQVERKSSRGTAQPTTMSAVEPGDKVVIWTKREAPTYRNERGLPGTWDASRVRIVD